MSRTLPTTEDIAALVAFLPRLEAIDADALCTYETPSVVPPATIALSFPIYHEVVQEFLDAAREHCWKGPYNPGDAGRLVQDQDYIAQATLEQLRALVTYFVRGERFCDGHWAMMLRKGHIQTVLRRLSVLAETKPASEA